MLALVAAGAGHHQAQRLRDHLVTALVAAGGGIGGGRVGGALRIRAAERRVTDAGEPRLGGGGLLDTAGAGRMQAQLHQRVGEGVHRGDFGEDTGAQTQTTGVHRTRELRPDAGRILCNHREFVHHVEEECVRRRLAIAQRRGVQLTQDLNQAINSALGHEAIAPRRHGQLTVGCRCRGAVSTARRAGGRRGYLLVLLLLLLLLLPGLGRLAQHTADEAQRVGQAEKTVRVEKLGEVHLECAHGRESCTILRQQLEQSPHLLRNGLGRRAEQGEQALKVGRVAENVARVVDATRTKDARAVQRRAADLQHL
mmetsp:Transcript_7127/g.21821  ORF Transcript_7127/g.21821 Transcript_7127/m.21821 type:complete len:311 (-) Transcript_7127:3120-4052(-)